MDFRKFSFLLSKVCLMKINGSSFSLGFNHLILQAHGYSLSPGLALSIFQLSIPSFPVDYLKPF